MMRCAGRSSVVRFGWWLSLLGIVGSAAASAAEPAATPVSAIQTLPGFQVERLYSVPASQGSWVSMTFDRKGRIIACDQNGGLYRITPPPHDKTGELAATAIEPLQADIGGAQGLLWVGDALYVVVNHPGPFVSGLYRLRDTNGDDQFDEVKLLRKLQGTSEHGPHGIVLGPDGKSLYLVAGNFTKLPELQSSRVPRRWAEDQLLPRLPDGGGHDPHIMAPGGWIARTSLDGDQWELICTGMRNGYDLAFDRDGELFTFDSDMEWDIGAPWYRPTRVCHVQSGAEFGWRNGSGKFPSYYPDSVPAAVDIGPGSPTGILFGYNARFPTKYREALFILDWSYGIIYCVHLEPQGSTYTGVAERFLSGTPLPLTDVAIGPDGAMYFTIGGRKVQSGMYRVTYTGSESTEPAAARRNTQAAELRAVRSKLGQFHGQADLAAVASAWPYLSHADRAIRSAARVAIEHQPVAEWQERALAEKQPEAALQALLALARCGEPAVQGDVLKALARLDWDKLSEAQRLALVRVYDLTFIRLGQPSPEVAASVAERFGKYFPASDTRLNRELSMLLVYLQSPEATGKTLALLTSATAPEEQIHYGMVLRQAKTGWTPETRSVYFKWLQQSPLLKGGHSLAGFLKRIQQDALANVDEQDRAPLAVILAEPLPKTSQVATPRPLVKEWTQDEILKLAESGLKGRNFEQGRAMFGATQCANCHRFQEAGSIGGPDLSVVANRFNVRDLVDAILEPSKVVSDQYQASTFVMANGKQHTGRLVNLSGENIMIVPNLLAPDEQISIKQKDIEEVIPSKLSLMPTGLLNTLHEDELLDLLAYLLSRGDREHVAFKK